MQDPGSWVLPLSDPLCTDASLTGGKAAALCQLVQEQLPVPDAFVITQEAFDAHLPAPDQEQRPERPVLSTDLRASLQATCTALGSVPGMYLAVRSSALDEDGYTHSFAGQHATYYYVTPDTIDKAVVDCWMSLWSTSAIAYRQGLDSSPNGFGMAVIVQKMIQAERSGVCFTQDPTGAKPDEALIESSWGLGAALVDGRVSPDRFWLAADGSIQEQKIARKRLKVSEDLRDPGEQRLESVPVSKQTQASLDSNEAGQIVELSRQIALNRQLPQDVEWAIDDGQVYILQSRPITSINLTPPQVDGRWVLFKPLAENFSEPITPMTVDLFRRVMPPIGCFIQGRFYVSADLMQTLIPFHLDEESLTDLLLMRGAPVDRIVDWGRALKAAGWIALGYLAGGVTWHRTAQLNLDRLQEFEACCARALDDVELDPLATIRQLIINDHPLRPINEFVIQANISSGRYFLLTELLKKLLKRWAPAFDETKLGLLCSGGSEMLSQQMVEGVRDLADIAAEDDVLATAMLADDADLQALVIDLEEPDPFAIALQGFLKRFGHRAVRELDLIAPRWREDNTTVLTMVRNYLRQLRTADQTTNASGGRIDIHGLRLAAEDELHQALPLRWQRSITDKLISRIRYYVTLRENTRHYHTMAIATIRTKLKQLEQLLMQQGRLRCEDDIFFLEHPEAIGLKIGALTWEDVEPIIRTRRQRHHRLSQQQPVESFNMAQKIPVLQPDSAVLVGDCACPGVAEGVARVIHDPTLAAELEPGDILIAPYTDPAWTPLFPGAGAIVVEVGSYLSHAGTVAREYQVPCLVDVHNCTSKIRTGQRLRVNATEGWVEVMQ